VKRDEVSLSGMILHQQAQPSIIISVIFIPARPAAAADQITCALPLRTLVL